VKHQLHLGAAVLLLACSSSSSSPSASNASSGGAPDASSGDAAGGDTWTTYAKSFAATYCVECHDASDPKGRDYTVYAKLAAERAEARCGVASSQDPSWGCASFPPAKQFPIDDGKSPPNPKPSDAERARFVAWLGAGAPE
jgi:hypothetical protein